RLAATALADDDPVGAHTQAVDHQLLDGDFAAALDVGRLHFQGDHVLLAQLQLRRVLDGDDPFLVVNIAAQDVQLGGLAGAGAARNEDVQLGLDTGFEKVDHLRRVGAETDHIVGGQRVFGEFADGDAR